MKQFNKVLRFFGIGASSHEAKEEVLEQKEIKFSSLVESIHSDLTAANESLQGVGLKYIERFFDKPLSEAQEQNLVNKIERITESLEQGDKEQSQTLLASLKNEVKQENAEDRQYKPKMVKLDMPVLNNGVWQSQQISVPLLTLAPLSVPQITSCTIKSKLETIKQQDDDVYVKVLSSTQNNKRKLTIDPSHVTELVLSIEPSQSETELEELISQYKKNLSHK